MCTVSKISFIWANITRGSSKGLFPVGPTKVKACWSILFTEDSPEVKIKTTCLIKQLHFILSHFASMLYTVAKYHIQLLHHICIQWLKGITVVYEKLYNNELSQMARMLSQTRLALVISIDLYSTLCIWAHVPIPNLIIISYKTVIDKVFSQIKSLSWLSVGCVFKVHSMGHPLKRGGT